MLTTLVALFVVAAIVFLFIKAVVSIPLIILAIILVAVIARNKNRPTGTL
jgi:hypothetical protein